MVVKQTAISRGFSDRSGFLFAGSWRITGVVQGAEGPLQGVPAKPLRGAACTMPSPCTACSFLPSAAFCPPR